MTKREELAKEYLAKGHWAGVTVPQALDLAVEAYPEHTALVCGSERVTYSEMRRRADSLAASFLERGISKGDIVTVQMPNWLEYIYVHYALARIGAITLPAIPLYRRREMSHILESYRSVGYVLPSHFGGFDYLKMLEEMRPSLPALRHIFVAGEPVPPGASSIRAMLSERPSPGRVPDGLTHHTDVACLVVTGGTTGYPKGVPRTHNELLCHARNWARVMETT
ncbi:MAG: AMP-binding protein, partial [Dehalococcoidia bacterium]|nr:AMP-binding protein [Dehalococcoidia bacterium]